ncbi:MAG: protein kinase, partial [Gemmatimonadales bacterium]
MTGPGVLDQLRAGLADRYEVEAQIGEGGMATVFRARDRKHGRLVAIKVLRPELAMTMGPERFLREIELAARLQHPHIVPLYDSGAVGPVLYYVMPFVEGESLRDRMARGRIPFDEAVTLAREIASALSYAHGQGVVHRDIKPENVMLSGGHAVVADFGIARAVNAAQDNQRLTGMGFAVGTPAYMSPEQATASEVDGRADQYSLACVFYEMVTGEAPFAAPTVQAALARSLTGPRPRLSKVAQATPPAADPVVARALDGDPGRRFDSVQAFADALGAATGGGTVAASRTRRLTTTVAVLAVALVATLGVLFFRPSGASPIRKEAASIAVLPFSVSGAGVETLGEGMVDLLTTNLNSVGGIRAVEPRLVLNGVRKAGGDVGDVTSALGLARGLDASSVVLGSVVAAGSRVRISAKLHGPDGGELASAQVDGAQDSVLQLVDALSASLVRGIWQSREPVPSLQVGGITTNSLPAMRAYLEGEQYYRRSRWDSAQAAFARAVAIDSTFSLAHLRRAASIGWTGGYGSPQSVAASDAALRFADRLPPRERALVVGYNMFSHGTPGAADTMRRYLAEYPKDVEGWFVLGEVRYHERNIHPLSSDSVRAPFDAVLALDSTLAPAAIHPAELALAEADTAALDHYIEVFADAGSADEAEAFRAARTVLATGVADSAAMARIGSRSGALWSLRVGLAHPDVDPDSALARFDRLGAVATKLGYRPAGENLAVIATTLLGMGRHDAAKPLIDSLSRSNGEMGYLAAVLPAMLGWPEGPSAAMTDRALAAPRRNPFQVQFVTQIALGRGDVGLAERLADSLARDSTAFPPMLKGLVAVTLGRVKLARGDTVGGLRLMWQGVERAGGNPIVTAPARLAYAEAL